MAVKFELTASNVGLKTTKFKMTAVEFGNMALNFRLKDLHSIKSPEFLALGLMAIKYGLET